MFVHNFGKNKIKSTTKVYRDKLVKKFSSEIN